MYVGERPGRTQRVFMGAVPATSTPTSFVRSKNAPHKPKSGSIVVAESFLRFAPESTRAFNIDVQQSIYVYTKRVRVYIKLSVLGLAHLGFPAASDDGGGYSR